MEQNRNRGSPRLLSPKKSWIILLCPACKEQPRRLTSMKPHKKKLPTRHRLRLTREEIETGQAAVETADAEPAMPQSSGRSFQGNRAKFAHTLARISKGS